MNQYDDPLRVFVVWFDEARTRVDLEDDEEVMGIGVQFPFGRAYVDWNLNAYPPEDRLDHPHVSVYGSLDDVEQGTGGTVDVIQEIAFEWGEEE